ncbi:MULTISPECIES: hypothetical protein [Enterococcus]|nr:MULTISPECIES: hypothetical protein [Enterococcus]MBO1123660.1 hypothetical protein [Enterococcus casseliflavus]TPR55461.1 hypothetical protein FJU10_16945 [Enterococcus sp. OL5]
MDIEDSQGEIFSMLFYCLTVLAFLSVVVFGYQLQTITTYRQQVNYQIERKGGLTAEAVSELKEYSTKQFHGWYTIESTQLGKKAAFGDTVAYTIKATYPVLFLPDNISVKIGIEGQAPSQVR